MTGWREVFNILYMNIPFYTVYFLENYNLDNGEHVKDLIAVKLHSISFFYTSFRLPWTVMGLLPASNAQPSSVSQWWYFCGYLKFCWGILRFYVHKLYITFWQHNKLWSIYNNINLNAPYRCSQCEQDLIKITRC